jgi:hypothetical protein
VETIEAPAVGLQRVRESVLRNQEVNEEVDPLTECRQRRVGARQKCRAGLGAGLDLMAVDGDNEIGPSREVAVDRPDPDAGFGRDLTDRRVDAGGDEDRRGGVEQRLLVA